MRRPFHTRITCWALSWVAIACWSAVMYSGLHRQAAAAPPAGELIGKLEGPDVVTDPATYPKNFQEAPQLAELVKTKKLPPVHERVSQDPLVIKPVHEIGKYGGTWRRGFSGPADFWNGYRCCGHDKLLFWDYTGNKIVPNVAKGWELSSDGRSLTLSLRRGMKWSDGHPFTADDFLFWYEDIYQNAELVPAKAPVLSINGKPGKIEKVDAVTVKFTFEDPYFAFADVLAGATHLGGHSYQGRDLLGGFAPKHYLQQFHPKYAGKEQVDKLVKAAGYDNWVGFLKFKNDWALNPELPTVAAWKTTTPINTPNWVLERNPYFYMVDTAGNQLPYIDKVIMTVAENLEVLNLRAIAGEYDFQARHIDISKLPVFLENQARATIKSTWIPRTAAVMPVCLSIRPTKRTPKLPSGCKTVISALPSHMALTVSN